MLDYHTGAGQPVQVRHTHLCSYRRNLRNVCVRYTFIEVPVVSVGTRIMLMYVCVSVCMCVCIYMYINTVALMPGEPLRSSRGNLS